ncbi:MAG: CARDB domain-containing protein [Xenococcaceae cyanobacterium MO_188.B19]|nr:CARDB domain-containing protein [Xenococcaceae cyanobacterium MO_188.B19]
MTIDLTATTFTIPSYILKPEEIFNLEFNIINQGNDNSDSFDIEFYLSTDNLITNQDTLLGKQTITGITANSNTELLVNNLNLSPSNPLLANGNGMYYLGAIIDRDNVIAESKEDNNTITVDDSTKVQVVSVAPSFFNVAQKSANMGDKVHIIFSLDNLASAVAEDVEVEFYLSPNDLISTTDLKLGSFTVDNIPGEGNSGNQIVGFDLPPDSENLWRIQENGTYSVGMIIPGNNESNRVTNFYTGNKSQFVNYDQINITNASDGSDQDTVERKDVTSIDLMGEEFRVVQDKLLHPADFIDINFKILNQGQTNAGGFTVEFYLSNNEYISHHDIKLGSVDISSLAGASSTELLAEKYQLPDADHEIWDEVDGTYHVGMLINRDNQVQEHTQLNNNNQAQFIDSDNIFVAELESKDVFGIDFNVVEEASEANPLVPGQNINLEYELYNQGSEDVEFSAVGFYLFTEDYLKNNQQLSYNEIENKNPDIHFVFGDRDSTFLEISPDETTRKRTLEVQLPDNWDTFNRVGDGYYYMGILSDQWEEVVEANEQNNSLFGELIDYEKVYIDVV